MAQRQQTTPNTRATTAAVRQNTPAAQQATTARQAGYTQAGYTQGGYTQAAQGQGQAAAAGQGQVIQGAVASSTNRAAAVPATSSVRVRFFPFPALQPQSLTCSKPQPASSSVATTSSTSSSSSAAPPSSSAAAPSSSNTSHITVGTVSDTPQTIPNASPSSAAASTSSSDMSSGKSNFPVAAIAVVAIVGGIIALFLAYRLYVFCAKRKGRGNLLAGGAGGLLPPIHSRLFKSDKEGANGAAGVGSGNGRDTRQMSQFSSLNNPLLRNDPSQSRPPSTHLFDPEKNGSISDGAVTPWGGPVLNHSDPPTPTSAVPPNGSVHNLHPLLAATRDHSTLSTRQLRDAGAGASSYRHSSTAAGALAAASPLSHRASSAALSEFGQQLPRAPSMYGAGTNGSGGSLYGDTNGSAGLTSTGGGRRSMYSSPGGGGSGSLHHFGSTSHLGAGAPAVSPVTSSNGSVGQRSSTMFRGAPHLPHNRGVEITVPSPLGPPPGAVVASDRHTLQFSTLSGISDPNIHGRGGHGRNESLSSSGGFLGGERGRPNEDWFTTPLSSAFTSAGLSSAIPGPAPPPISAPGEEPHRFYPPTPVHRGSEAGSSSEGPFRDGNAVAVQASGSASGSNSSHQYNRPGSSLWAPGAAAGSRGSSSGAPSPNPDKARASPKDPSESEEEEDEEEEDDEEEEEAGDAARPAAAAAGPVLKDAAHPVHAIPLPRSPLEQLTRQLADEAQAAQKGKRKSAGKGKARSDGGPSATTSPRKAADRSSQA